MNWVIKSTKKIGRHTDLSTLLNKDWIEIKNYNWFLSDLDIINFDDYEGKSIPIDFREEFQLPNTEIFTEISKANIQIIWGVISAVKNEIPEFNPIKLPYVEGNDKIWNDNYFQIPNSLFEITAWDSSYTIIKFRDKNLSKKFKNCFPEAILLSEFKLKFF